MLGYLTDELGWQEDNPYEIISRHVHPWNWGSENGFVNLSDRLSDCHSRTVDGGCAELREEAELEGFALVGVRVRAAETPALVLGAWHDLDADVGLVILSAAAAEVLGPTLTDRPGTITVVMP